MRQIKFRVWNGETMISPDYIDRDGTAWWKENSIPTCSKELMQFTGLYDKNGKEIYEGDKIMFTINFSDERNRAYWSEDSFIGLVFWDTYKWSIKNVSFAKMHDQDYVFNMQYRQFDKDLLQRYCSIKKAEFSEVAYITVRGNIHENPELL